MSIKEQLIEDIIETTSGYEGISKLLNRMLMKSIEDGTSEYFFDRLSLMKEEFRIIAKRLEREKLMMNIRKMVKIEENETPFDDFVEGEKYIEVYDGDYTLVCLMEIRKQSNKSIHIKYHKHPVQQYGNELGEDNDIDYADKKYFNQSKCYRVIE